MNIEDKAEAAFVEYMRCDTTSAFEDFMRIVPKLAEDARADGYRAGIEAVAQHFEKHYRDYVWCRTAVEGIRSLKHAEKP